MTQLNNIRMESIFYGLSELKHEKLCLAQKLQEQRIQRQTLEQDLEQASVRNSQVQEKQRRMAETFAVAQQKIDESLTSVRTIEGKIGDNKPGIDCIQRTIVKEKTCQTDSLSEFEICLSTISSELFNARSFYKEKALLNEITKMEAKRQGLARKKDQDEKSVQTLTYRLRKLMSDEICCHHGDGMEATLTAIIGALERDKQEVYDYLQRLKSELQSVHDALKNTQACV